MNNKVTGILFEIAKLCGGLEFFWGGWRGKFWWKNLMWLFLELWNSCGTHNGKNLVMIQVWKQQQLGRSGILRLPDGLLHKLTKNIPLRTTGHVSVPNTAKKCEVTQSCRRAAQQLWLCTYFFAPALSPSWKISRAARQTATLLQPTWNGCRLLDAKATSSDWFTPLEMQPRGLRRIQQEPPHTSSCINCAKTQKRKGIWHFKCRTDGWEEWYLECRMVWMKHLGMGWI